MENISTLIDSLDSYLGDDNSLFVHSTNFTYFGRMYNYFGESKYKSKTFLKDMKNEKEVLDYLKKMDEVGFYSIQKMVSKQIADATNFVYSKNVLLFACELYKKLVSDGSNFDLEQLVYSTVRQESSTDDSDYEINLVSFMSIVVVKPLSN